MGLLKLSVVAVCCALAGCSTALGPHVRADLAVDATAQWMTAANSKADGEPISDPWWIGLGDQNLTPLIEGAITGNPSLHQVKARIDRARALAKMSRKATHPEVSLDIDATSDSDEHSAAADLGVSLTLDYTGRLAKLAEAARYRYQASEAAYRYAKDVLAAEVASSYFEYVYCERATTVAKLALHSRKQTMILVGHKVAAGATAKVTLYQVQAGVAEAENAVKAQEGNCKRQAQTLIALTAMPAEEVLRLLRGPSDLPEITPIRFTSLPVDVIRNRSDVAQLAYLVEAAAKDIGVAETAKLPSITLSGTIGITGESGAPTWSWGPQLHLPIFDGGRIQAGVSTAAADYQEALAAWRSKVLAATQEVEDSLIRLDVVRNQVADADFALARYGEVFGANEARFNEGAASLLELEDARRSALSAKQNRLDLSLEYIRARISLYKAAGGAVIQAQGSQNEHDRE